MTDKAVADDVLGRFARQEHDWFERVRKGSLDPEAVARAVQVVIDQGNVTEMVIGDRTYEILRFLRGDEEAVSDVTVVERAKEKNTNLGQEDGQYLLDHQDEIPEVLQGKVTFVFTGWRFPSDQEVMALVCWRRNHWVQRWSLTFLYGRSARILRRKPAHPVR